MRALASAILCWLTAGELRRQAPGVVFHVHELQQLACFRVSLRLADTTHLEAECDVVHAAQMREQRVILKHHRSRSAGGREIVDEIVTDVDLALRNELVSGDHSQRRGLPTTARPEQATIRAVGDGQVDAVDGDHGAVALGETFETNFTIHRGHDARQRPLLLLRTRAPGCSLRFFNYRVGSCTVYREPGFVNTPPAG